MSIENKLTYLEGTKTAIKDAIVAKGVAIDDNATFRSYATAISTIETGGGTEINNQTKTVEINQNGQTTVSYDEGYTGLESVVINTNVPTGSGSCNVSACFDGLGYEALPLFLAESLPKSIELKQQVESGKNVLSLSNYHLLNEIDFLPLIVRDDLQIKYLQGKFINFPPIKANIDNGSNLFSSNYNLKYVDISNLYTTKSELDLSYCFYNCSGLIKIIGLEKLDVSNKKVTSFNLIFKNCSSLEEVDMTNFQYSDMSSISNLGFNDMFTNCISLISVKLPNFVKNVTYLTRTFSGCEKLEELYISGWDTSNVTEMVSTFAMCKSLKKLDLTSWNTSNVTNFGNFIQECTNLEQIKGYLDIMSVSNKFSNYYYMIGFSRQNNLRQMAFKNIGYASNAKTFDMTYFTNWGVNSETITDARQSLIDSLITYSFDRATAGYSSCTLKLAANTKVVLTEEEIAQITAKNYTIA